MMNEPSKETFLDTFDVPIQDPPQDTVIQEKAPVILRTRSTLDEVIEELKTIEEGFVLYRITQPKVLHRYVLVNTAMSKDPSFMSIVSGRYRVLRPSVALSMISEALKTYHEDELENMGLLATIQRQVSLTLTHKKYKFPLLVYVNSFDRTTRELVILPGLRAVKYTHTKNGKNKEDMARLVDLAFNQKEMTEWFEQLRNIEIPKTTFLRFIKVNLSTTPRALLTKILNYQEPISEFTEKDFENVAYDEYIRRYGRNLLGFVEFIHDVHRTQTSKKNVHRAVMAIQAGSSLVETMVRASQ